MPPIHRHRHRHRLSVLATAYLLALALVRDGGVPPVPCARAQLQPDDPEHEDFYCGLDWTEANADCAFPCPSGRDGDCPPTPKGRKRRCFAAAGCYARSRTVRWTGSISLAFDGTAHRANLYAPPDATSEWIPTMTDEEAGAFESAFARTVSDALDEGRLRVAATVLEQRYDRPCVGAALGIVEDYDPSSSVRLDMIVEVVGEYIPVDDFNFTDETFGDRVLDAVDGMAESFGDAIRYETPTFFDAVTGIWGMEEDDIGEAPSASPSAAPSPGFDQSLDVPIDPFFTGSYGISFNVRTVRCGQRPGQRTCGTILITGMSFVTNQEGPMEYEVYSRLGPFDKFVGRTDSWELVASGRTDGRGEKEYTPVLTEDTTGWDEEAGAPVDYVGFRPLHVPGNRAQRSFYVTATKRLTKEDGEPIPILFMPPIQAETDGTREYQVIESTPELEVWEGDGVLDYPWPPYRDGQYYRRPRGFMGSFEYDRYPCHPALNFTGWPCPYFPRTDRPTGGPTGRPLATLTTMSPVWDATNAATMGPTTVTPVQADVQTGTESPELASSVPDANTTDSNDTVPELGAQETNGVNGTTGPEAGAQKEETMNKGTLSWRVAYIVCFCGVILFTLCF